MALNKQKKCKDAQHPSCSTHRPQTVRASSYPPVHRESLVPPQHTLITPRDYHSGQTMDTQTNLGTGEPARSGSQAGDNNQEDDAVAFQDWLSPFCQEPPGGDADTCCMGFWVPCVLYGKSAWRLKALALDEDDNRRWTPKNGCNGHCWGWLGAACVATPCFAGNASSCPFQSHMVNNMVCRPDDRSTTHSNPRDLWN